MRYDVWMILKALRFITFWIALGALGVLTVSVLFKPETLPKLQVCAFKQYTGKPCPGCGLTRAFCAISHGRFSDALHFNPFAFILYAATLALSAWPIAAHYSPRLKAWAEHTTFFAWTVPITFVAMIVYGAIRMLYGPNV